MQLENCPIWPVWLSGACNRTGQITNENQVADATSQSKLMKNSEQLSCPASTRIRKMDETNWSSDFYSDISDIYLGFDSLLNTIDLPSFECKENGDYSSWSLLRLIV